MKKIIIPLLLTLLVAQTSTAQTQDLISLAEGDYLGMNALFDEDGHLFGYISIYDYGKSGEKTKKFEYVILDKNLNPFANNTFEGDITAADYFGYINFDGYIILVPTYYDRTHLKAKEMFSPSSMQINLKDNTIKKKVSYEYDHGTFKEKEDNELWKTQRKERRVERKKDGFNYGALVTEIKEGGYLVTEYEDHGSYIRNNVFMRYNEEKERLWKFEYNNDSSTKKRESLYFLGRDDDYYYGLFRQYQVVLGEYGTVTPSASEEHYHLLVINMKTGEIAHKKKIEDPEEVLPLITDYATYAYGMLDNSKEFDDKIVFIGRLTSGMYNKGISRLLIDKKTFETEIKILTYKDDFKKFIPNIKARGVVENGYFLDPRDIFYMKDGGVSILYEKYKPASQYTASKTTDMVLVSINKDFEIKNVSVLEKEKSKYSNTDYLFSQNLNDDNDLVFFYRDYQKDDETKDKNWNLFINTFIDGKFKQEMIPISAKEDYFILPYVAKEGYILLQELNKKAKYNMIRLERLNY